MISISFPYYSLIFYPNNKKEVIIVDHSDIETIDFTIKGMTCDACQNHIDFAVNELDGIVSVESSYNNANAIIKFDNTKTNIKEIKTAINSTGFKVKDHD